jgi:hypothetical protein
MEFEKAKAELPILRDFVDFMNRQVGVYSDCLASFSGNKVRIERQILAYNGQPADAQRMDNPLSFTPALRIQVDRMLFIIELSDPMNSSQLTQKRDSTRSNYAGRLSCLCLHTGTRRFAHKSQELEE